MKEEKNQESSSRKRRYDLTGLSTSKQIEEITLYHKRRKQMENNPRYKLTLDDLKRKFRHDGWTTPLVKENCLLTLFNMYNGRKG